MKGPVRRIVFWMPRVLCVLFAAFVSVFALDVFGEGYGLWETIVALLIHLVPTGIILIALIVAWRWEWLGALLFTALGVGYVVVAGQRVHWTATLLIAGPLFLIGVLFLVDWLYERRGAPRI